MSGQNLLSVRGFGRMLGGRWRLACLLAIGAAGLSAPLAHAQMDSREGIELQHQLLELKRDVQNLRDQPARGGSALSSAPSRGSSDSNEITVHRDGEPVTLALDAESGIRNVDGGRGMLSPGEVPAHYRPGDEVMVIPDAGRVKLLRKPKY